MKIKTQAIGFNADSKLRTFIEQRLPKLDQFYDRIISAEVALKLENSGQIKDKIAEIRINVPGNTLIAKETQKTFEASIDFSIDSLKRQLKKHKDKQSARR